MPRLSDLDQMSSAQVEANDLMYIVDSSETDPDLRSKKMTMADVVGSIKAISGTDLGEWEVTNGNITLSNNKQVYVNVLNNNDITITLPALPSPSSKVVVVVNRAVGASANILINLNGERYISDIVTASLILSQDTVLLTLIYVSSAIGWISEPKLSSVIPSNSYTHSLKYVGNSTTLTLPKFPIDPDLIFIKGDFASHWIITDTVSNNNDWTKHLTLNLPQAISTSPSTITSLTDQTITFGDDTRVNQNGIHYMMHMHKKAPESGFNILTYTSTNTNLSLAHGLPSAPTFIIVKGITAGYSWIYYHKDLEKNTYGLLADNFTSLINASDKFTQPPDNTNIYLGTSAETGANTHKYIVYAWTDVKGLCKTGYYLGSGHTFNAPFVELGFQPKIVWIKPMPSSIPSGQHSPMVIVDNTYDAPNPMNRLFKGNEGTTGSQGSNTFTGLNFTEAGFQPLDQPGSGYNWLNTISTKYIYVAWG